MAVSSDSGGSWLYGAPTDPSQQSGTAAPTDPSILGAAPPAAVPAPTPGPIATGAAPSPGLPPALNTAQGPPAPPAASGTNGIDWNSILNNPQQWQLQKSYQDWYMQQYFPQMYALQQQMQNAQINLGNYNADWQGALGQANMMGSMNGQVTFPAQTMMNQMALQEGNQNLTARGQNAAYDQALMNMASNTGAQDTSYALGGMNLAGQTGAQNAGIIQGGQNLAGQIGAQQAGIIQGGQNLAAQTGAQDVQMANIQAQLAQSPLVAWYTARGLPPPQSAIMTAQAPDLGQQLSTLGQYMPQAPNLNSTLGSLNQYMPAAPNLQNQFQNIQQYMPGAPNLGQQISQIPQLGQFTPPNLSWNFQNTPPAVPSLPIQGGGTSYQYPTSNQPISFQNPTPGSY